MSEEIARKRMARRDSDIDGLYQLPLDQFTAARTALAKESESGEAPGIRALAKPTLPAWAVNQIYWTARDKYDALVAAAERLRSAHRAALAGKKVDLRDPDDAHRRALNVALKEGIAILARAGHPATSSTVDVVSKTLAALPVDSEPPGRLTRPLTPGGFELFANVKPAARVLRMPDRRPAERAPTDDQKRESQERRRGAAREALREAEATLRKAESAAARLAERVERAEAALAEAERDARDARRNLEKADARVAAAQTALDEVRRTAQRAARELTDATAGRDTADRRLREL
jgi:hypothetical protein